MRPEKRNTLIALLISHFDSYWWIDVLCTRTETPLDIMGDIYACCTQCIAMIDCSAEVISKVCWLAGVARLLNMSCQYARQCFDKDQQYNHFDDSLDRCMEDQHEQWAAHLDKLTQCHWWNRVLTWQELVLPTKTVFMAETATEMSRHTMLSTAIMHMKWTSWELIVWLMPIAI
ncbi:hypothetical protein O0I10_011775 [Lichtheimia ornata]|uniref:Heterokaryon incompatibility domain-containing protein n=1 Tax=Lichtheimia ornata TaxID=688661 RepID=A0AAD7UST4_9FUNG|nr:uncharacterized protein O0I10_011775 [Lichtheimia ornata]KAJ8652570.1 hypothetical protein O0I10_011775 [Lichtheimia ornata]